MDSAWKFIVAMDRRGVWRWRLLNPQFLTEAVSQGFGTRQAAIDSLTSVRQGASAYGVFEERGAQMMALDLQRSSAGGSLASLANAIGRVLARA